MFIVFQVLLQMTIEDIQFRFPDYTHQQYALHSKTTQDM
jgi:hypothetical protein